jgi:hypothetical protein
MLDQRRQHRAGRLIGDDVCVSPSLVAKVICSLAKPLKPNRMTRNWLRLAESPFPAVVHTAVSRAFPPCINAFARFSCGAVDLVDGVFAHASECEIITGGAVR